jgi:hypothetical protein
MTRDELRELKRLITKANQLIAVRDAKKLLDEAANLIRNKLQEK